MDQETIMLIAIGGIIVYLINLAVWHSVMKSATKSEKILQQQMLQSEILRHMALSSGIKEETIDEIFDTFGVVERAETASQNGG